MNTTKKARPATKKKTRVEHIDLLGDVRRSTARGPLDTRSQAERDRDTSLLLLQSSMYGKFGNGRFVGGAPEVDPRVADSFEKLQTIFKGFYETGGAVVHPKHYNSHPSGVECIAIVEHMTFNTGSAMKYCWRAGLKTEGVLTEDAADTEAVARIKDLEKARWYLTREIDKLTQEHKLALKRRLNESFGVVGLAPAAPAAPARAKKAARTRKKGKARS